MPAGLEINVGRVSSSSAGPVGIIGDQADLFATSAGPVDVVLNIAY